MRNRKRRHYARFYCGPFPQTLQPFEKMFNERRTKK